MPLRPYSFTPGVLPSPAALDYFRRHVAALAARMPAIVRSRVADRQMLLQLLDEQIAYLHRFRRLMVPASPKERQLICQWTVLCFHLEGLQKELRGQTQPAVPARCSSACTCDLPYDPTLAHARLPDIYIPLEPQS
jgi:hypothetical protein